MNCGRTPAAWLGGGLLALGLALRWITPPLLAATCSHCVPLIGNFERVGKFAPVSYGVLVALATLAMLAGWLLRRPLATRLAALAVLALVVFLPVQIAFAKPAWLRALVNEHDEYRRLYSFANIALPLNRGLEPTFDANLELTSLPDRFTAARSFLGQGWTCTGVGAAILFLVSGAPLSRSRKWWTRAALAAALILPAACVLPGPIVAELAMRQALWLDAAGDSAGAQTAYRRALATDAWYRRGPFVYRQLGEIDDRLNHHDPAEYWLYTATQDEGQSLLHDAVFAYERAAALGTFADVAHCEAARAASAEGAQFFLLAMPGEAVAAWQVAMSLADRQYLAKFGIARGEHLLADYDRAVESNLALIKLFKNPLVLANVHSNLGDAYMKLGQGDEARRHYATAQRLDNDRNFRAYNSLAGQ